MLSCPLELHARIAPAHRITRLQDREPQTLAVPTRALSKVDGLVDSPDPTPVENLLELGHLVHGDGRTAVDVDTSAE